MMKKLILLFLVSLNVWGQSISSIGSWTPIVSTITEAGNDYTSNTIQSGASQTLISITMPSIFFGIFANHYTVNVKRTDSGNNWDTAGLQIWVKRTGGGTGGGTGGLGGVSNIIGGNVSFQQITTGNTYFFDGNNYGTTPRSNIPIQYEIRGISVLVPVANYSTTLTFTLIDD